VEAATVSPPRARPDSRPRLARLGRRMLDGALRGFAGLILLYLLVPIVVIIAFSFNDTQSRYNFVWDGFTLDYWKDPFGFQGLGEALQHSLLIAGFSTVAATVLGTMMALALVRYQFRGRGAVNFFIFLPLASPEVVLGAALLSLFLSAGVALGFTTVLIAHIMFRQRRTSGPPACRPSGS
jgi:spermidine/putrescine transport system permease protein